MHIRVPLLRQTSGSSDDQVDLLGSLNHSPWEIDVSSDNNLYYSIALCYLMPHMHEGVDVFNQILQQMAGTEVTDSEAIMECIKWYNPFLNRHACFYNQKFKALIQAFGKRLEEYVIDTEHERYFEGFPKLYSEDRIVARISSDSVMQAASFLLQSHICLISEPRHTTRKACLNEPSLTCYPKLQNSSFDQKMVFYRKRKAGKGWQRISFGLPLKLATSLQKTALSKILRMGDIKKEEDMETIFSMPEARNNLIIALLKNKQQKIVERLLTSPIRIMLKLAEAGFCTNPTVKDSTNGDQNTAFYYALLTGGTRLLFLLYNYSINVSTSVWSTSSTREPDACVVDNLMQLTSVIDDTRKAYESSQCPVECDRISIVELAEFHSFQSEVCKNIHSIRQRINYSTRISDERYEVEKRKDIVLTIVSAYKEHFQIGDTASSSETDKQLKLFENYAKYQNYFRNLDFQASLFFFDHSFALKQKLKLKDKICENMETSFVRFLFLWKYYSENVDFFESRRRSSSAEAISSLQKAGSPFADVPRHLEKFLFTLTYLERLNLEEAMGDFQNRLEGVKIEEQDITERLSPSYIHTLADEPIIKDEIILLRLKHYIDLALNVNLEESFEMSVAAIERCIQIIGESLNLDKDDSPTFVKSLLISSLPEITKTNIRKIRHNLSHFSRAAVSARLEIENNKIFFRDILDELRTIDESFTHIFKLQSLRMRKYALENGIRIVKKWVKTLKKPQKKQDSKNQLSEKENIVMFEHLFGMTSEDKAHRKMPGAQAQGEGNSSQHSYTNFETYLRRRFKVLGPHLHKTRNELMKKSKSLSSVFDKHFESHFNWINETCEKLSEKKVNNDDIQRLKNRFLSVKLLLQFIVDESGCKVKNIKALREKIIATRSLEDNSKTKIKELLEEYKNLKTYIFEELNALNDGISDNVSTSTEFENGKEIHRFRLMLTGHCFLSEEIKVRILSEVPEAFVEHHRAKEKLRISLETENILSDQDRDDLLKNFILESENTKKIKEMYDNRDIKGIEAVMDNYEKLEKSLNANEIGIKDYDFICEKFEFSDKTKSDLSKILLGQPKSTKDEVLEYFYDRLVKLKKLLIETYPEINELFAKAKSLKTKEYGRDKLVRYYLQQPLLQAAVEQMLFDCVVILKEKELDLEYLWIKTNHLFNGINLRNVLAHRNALFEGIGYVLDPSDLPNEIVAKTLELVSDIDAIAAMCHLRKEMDITFEDFIENIDSDEHQEHHDTWMVIKDCCKWQSYAHLLPRRRMETFSTKDAEEEEEIEEEEEEEMN